MKHCEVTGKLKHRDNLAVLLAYARAPKKTRAYRCEFCGCWHATSQPKRSPEST